MSQSSLFYESINDALREAVRACGGTKCVAVKLWPEKAPDAAGRLLADCLNEHRAERLNPEQLLLLARMAKERGCHAVMYYMAQELGYTEPAAIEPDDEKAALMREFIASQKHMAKILERIERTGSTLRSVA